MCNIESSKATNSTLLHLGVLLTSVGLIKPIHLFFQFYYTHTHVILLVFFRLRMNQRLLWPEAITMSKIWLQCLYNQEHLLSFTSLSCRYIIAKWYLHNNYFIDFTTANSTDWSLIELHDRSLSSWIGFDWDGTSANYSRRIYSSCLYSSFFLGKRSSYKYINIDRRKYIIWIFENLFQDFIVGAIHQL